MINYDIILFTRSLSISRVWTAIPHYFRNASTQPNRQKQVATYPYICK